MTVQEAVDILLRVRDIQEPYPSTDVIDEAITIVTEALDINNVSRKEAKIVIVLSLVNLLRYFLSCMINKIKDIPDGTGVWVKMYRNKHQYDSNRCIRFVVDHG